MFDCNYTSYCTKHNCDNSCNIHAEISHWMTRCNISLNNPALKFKDEDLDIVNTILKTVNNDDMLDNSPYYHLCFLMSKKYSYIADVLTYVCICNYGLNTGFKNGVYKLNLFEYLDLTKQSWNSRIDSEKLSDMRIYIESAKYLIIYNLGLIRFGDFESQTLLSIFQERSKQDKYTIVVVSDDANALIGKQDSIFYKRLKDEFKSRGVRA